MNQNVFIGRQPILNREQEIIAYELLFRDGSGENAANFDDDVLATSRVMVTVLSSIGVNRVLGDKLGFVNINEKIIEKNIFEPFDRTKFVFEFLETTIITDEFISEVTKMKEDGYVFALDDFVANDENMVKFAPLFDLISIVKIDLILNEMDSLEDKLTVFRERDIKLLAEKVETLEEFEFCKDLGFDLFQGYFFAKPVIIKGKHIDHREIAVLDIVRLLQQSADINMVENEFKKYPDLMISLFKYVNSAALSRGNEIQSVRQALALLGEKKILQWLYIMLYAKSYSGDTASHPLFITASQRAKSMELLYSKIHKRHEKVLMDKAFLVGMLSQLDALLHVSIEEILDDLNVSRDIYDAIIDQKGELGELLNLIVSSEVYELDKVKGLLGKLNIKNQDLVSATLESYSWIENLK
ncbi:MAG: EAL domain-containing protein [Reichenbachiella sp.]